MPLDAVDGLSEETARLELDAGPGRAPAEEIRSSSYPAHRIQSKGTVASDITASFTNAAQKLAVGKLVKDDLFTLFESVAALEIMDPKMDSGFLAPGETLDDEYDVSRPLLPEEVIGIIDQLLCHEMAWHMGHPLSQTVFTSLYIEKIFSVPTSSLDQMLFDSGERPPSEPEPLTLRVLRAYCLALIKTCWHVNNRVKAEHFYEEEDFVTHTYNRDLLERVEDSVILDFLEATSSSVSGSTEIPKDLKDALLTRLFFRARFLLLVANADDRTSNSLKLLWQNVTNHLSRLKTSFSLGKPVPDAFSSKLQRKLASTIPPRPIVYVSFDDAHRHLELLCEDGNTVVDVLEYHDSHSLLTFVTLFQGRKPQPSVYIRTLLQHYIFGDMIVLGNMSIRQILDDDLASTVLPGHELLDRDNDEIEVPRDPRYIMAQQMELFRGRAAQTYLDVIRTQCQNRCRIRRTLCRTISDWDNLQLDAEELDAGLRNYTKEVAVVDESISRNPLYSYPLSSWAYFYKLRQMEWVVQMGFELEVYHPTELAGMYWYLQYLAQTKSKHLERIRGVNIRRYSASGRRQTAIHQDPVFGPAMAFINVSMLEATATQGLADGLSCLYTALTRLKLISPPPQPYSDGSMRYELRMKPFLNIGLPELPSYAQFSIAVSQSDETTDDLILFAIEASTKAKKDIEVLLKLDPKTARCQGSEEGWTKGMKSWLKACIAASITSTVLQKAFVAAGKDGRVKLKAEVPPPEGCYHEWWIVPKVTPIA